jgi:hypothetical protein
VDRYIDRTITMSNNQENTDAINESAKSDSSVISTKKVASNFAEYIWNSPCLKAIVFNPFILAFFILLVIWVLDFIYGKKFFFGSPAIIAQHMITAYIIMAGGIAMNNMLIKHKYRMENYEVSQKKTISVSEQLISDYVD